ncbi:MAG: PIG-L family deacetylase [Acidobacteriaceae bacterium]|jgi:LmbE family N-acetylglucosaminyl deacetylase
MKTYAHRAPAVLASLAFALVLALPLGAQLTPQQDPANLAGERVSAPDLADTLPINHGAPALEQLLRKLRTRASFMLIVAHPDDEDNGALTYLSRGKGARVATLTLNRGEGGQNLMSADFDDALGLIRTQELLAADRYMDVDQFFGTEVDFGFTKTKEEAFAKWTHERVLYDVVRAIRLYRPLVIASVFIGEPSDGHGQHQVAGEIAQEAFKAAGDPNVFPDQIAAGLQPWQPLKVYARSPFGRIDAQGMYDYATSQYVPARFENYVTGKITSTVPKANVVVPEGDTDPLLGGISYAQLGRTGRALQKSQIGGGGGGFGGGGRADVSYHRYGSKLDQPDGDDSGLESGFFDGIDTSLPGIATLAPEVADRFRPPLEKIDALLAKAQHDFDAAHPEAVAPTLHDALASLDEFLHELENPAVNDLPPSETYNLLHELHIKRVQLNDALVLALGVTITADLAVPAPGHPLLSTQLNVSVDARVTNQGPSAVDFGTVGLQIRYGTGGTNLASFPRTQARIPISPGSSKMETAGVNFSPGLPITRPYFSRPDIEQPFYDVSEPALRDAPATPYPVTALATVYDQGVELQLAATVAYPALLNPPPVTPSDQPHLDPGSAVVVVPPVSIALSPRLQILTPGKDTFDCGIWTTPPYVDWAGMDLPLPDGWKFLDDAGISNPIGYWPLKVAVPATARRPATLHASFTLKGGAIYTENYRSVGYPGLVYTNYYTPATMRVVPVDVTTAPNLNIAYIPGTGDDVAAALDQLGVHPHIIAAAGLTAEALKPYDAVILGVRAYEHSDIAAANPALNAYAAAGGIVIAQYNTGRLPAGTGPFPIDLGGGEKVVEEDAPVKILAPDNPLLNWPNKITNADFDGWVEERGHGFMATWDPHYTALLETHDHGQPPQLGGLLVARTGRGAWIYLGLAVYRQLPEGVPGSYRLFANLISAAKNPGLQAAAKP